MQTFLPYPDYAQSAQCLDNRRLGKQRVECLQIMRTLTGQSSGWSNHPAVKMWRGYEWQLQIYAYHICIEWEYRGYIDTCREKIWALAELECVAITNPPSWLGDPAFHASHRSNLLRKDPEYYSRFGWIEPADLPYIWPV